MNNSKQSILILTDWFFPGFRAGGPIQSCVNLVRALEKEYNIYILTSSKDFGASKPYDSIKENEWLDFGEKSKVCYLSDEKMTLTGISERIKEVNSDFVYLNSMYSKVFTIYPLISVLYKKVAASKVILAPRGMLKASAIEFKKRKKNIFLSIFRFLGIHQKITFHATNETEQKEISTIFRTKKLDIAVIPNLPVHPIEKCTLIKKEEKHLKLFYLSRIHPIKNLNIVIQSLSKIKKDFKIHFDIGGFVEDETYWEKCLADIKLLPNNIKVEFIGKVNKEDVLDEIQKRHFFILPTQGENFGHAIFESFASGRPVIISNTTPWIDLEEKRVGWEVSLDDNGKFVTAIEKAALFNQESYDDLCQNSLSFAKNYIHKAKTKEQYFKMFFKSE